MPPYPYHTWIPIQDFDPQRMPVDQSHNHNVCVVVPFVKSERTATVGTYVDTCDVTINNTPHGNSGSWRKYDFDAFPDALEDFIDHHRWIMFIPFPPQP